MYFFGYGIDPLISYLDKRLIGIKIFAMPLCGLVPEESPHPYLPDLEERYRVILYAHDLKPAVVNMKELILVNKASSMFE